MGQPQATAIQYLLQRVSVGQQWPPKDTGASQGLKSCCHLQNYLELCLPQETTATVLNNLSRENGKSHLSTHPTNL